MTHGKKNTSSNLLINSIPARSASQLLSISDKHSSLSSNFLIIGLCISLANSFSFIFCLFKFMYSSLFVNGSQAIYVNSGYLKCMSLVSISPANEKLVYCFIHFISSIKLLALRIPTKRILLKFFFILSY